MAQTKDKWLSPRNTRNGGWFYVERNHVDVYTANVRPGAGNVKLTLADLRKMVRVLHERKRTATKVRKRSER